MWGGWDKIARSNFIIKLTSWEYWPFGIIQFPLFFYYPWLSLRAGSMTFFASSNPGITMGGMFGESKFDVLSKIPAAILPKTVLVKQPASLHSVVEKIKGNGFTFPLIFKPDIGERGYMVKRINDENDVKDYLQRMKCDFLIQELVELPLEFGIFYKRLPSEVNGVVTSVVMKEMLYVVGDGHSTLGDLVQKKDRAKLQKEKLKQEYNGRWDLVISKGEKVEIVSIGNHCLGTKFLNGNHLITPELSETFDRISKQIEGFYFGRYDLRCATIEDLSKGNVKVMELNGCGAEPAHIYDPGFSLWKAILTLIEHWRIIFEIAEENRSRGHEFLSFREALNHYRNFRSKLRAD